MLTSKELQVALDPLRMAIRNLGNGNASSEMGAIENLAKEVREGLGHVGNGLFRLAQVIEDMPR